MSRDSVIHRRTADNRRLLADFFDNLDEAQLETQSLCRAWTVRQVAAHLAMPLAVSLPSFLLQVVRSGGSVDRASEAVAARLAARPIAELTALLREQAGRRTPAPGVGPTGQLADG